MLAARGPGGLADLSSDSSSSSSDIDILAEAYKRVFGSAGGESKPNAEDKVEKQVSSPKPDSSDKISELESSSESSEIVDDTPQEKSKSPERKPRGAPRRRPVPLKHRGKIGEARLGVATPTCVFKKTPVCAMFKEILRDEMERDGVKITQNAVRMLAASLERQLLDSAVIANRLALSGNVMTVKPKHIKLAELFLSKPASNWSREDSMMCDENS